MIDINLNGIFATVRAAARHMRPRAVRTDHRDHLAGGDQGRAARSAPPTWRRRPARGTSCTRGLELAAYGITVNAIAPGFFVTNIGGGHAHNPEVQAAIAKDIPMHRVGQPDDIKALALFLAAPASEYITGQEIIIDGGWGLGVAD